MQRAAVVVVSAALTLTALPGLSGTAAAEPDYGQVLNILPPGQSGTITATDLAKVLAGDPQGRVARDGKNAPPNFADQLEMYDALNTVDPKSLTEDDLTTFYKPSTFDVPADQSLQRGQVGGPDVVGAGCGVGGDDQG